MSKVSIKDVAKEAGVSVSSVSFYMNRPERLSENSIAKIRSACEKLGYAPGKNRRGPKLGRRSRFKTRNICFYCMAPMSMEEMLRYPTIPTFLGVIQEELHKHHCRLVISGTGDSCQIPVTLSKKNCDGVILWGKSMNQEFYKNFQAKVADLPVIWAGPVGNDENNDYDHVSYSNKKIAELAAEYALVKKYHTIAVFNTHPEHTDYSERVRYFEEILKKYGLELYKFEPEEKDYRKTPAELIRKVADVFENAHIPKIDIAYFCSDLMLMQFRLEMFNRRRELDFEIFGCNGDMTSLDMLESIPATVNINLNALAKQTVKRLLQRIDNYRKPMATTEIMIEPTLMMPENK